MLAKLGAGFDCASLAEMRDTLALGVGPERIIHANPVKREEAIAFSREHGVTHMTFDSPAELDKIARLFPQASLVLRLHADDSRSLVRLGAKFGCAKADIETLLARAIELRLSVVGVSFHVGSGCMDPTSFSDAIGLARHAFDVAATLGLSLELLDIGGGFPGTPRLGDPACPMPAAAYRAHAAGTSQNPCVTFEQIAQAVNGALDMHFPLALFPALRVIAEPGRYFAQLYSTLVVQIFGRRVLDGVQYLHVDTGVYGALNNLIFDNAAPIPYRLTSLVASPSAAPLTEQAAADVPLMPTTIWGPTCDCMDVIAKLVPLPADLAIGEFLVYFQMGAYGVVAASSFNGMAAPEAVSLQRASTAVCAAPSLSSESDSDVERT